MYHPATRVLTVLEILQARGEVAGGELADRLEVAPRTVRNYVTMLRDLGIPIEARPGRHGGYRLRPGFRLPPLMFGDDEALAVTLGLLFARRFGLAGAAPAIEGALAKLERVLPVALRQQTRALTEALVLDPPRPSAGGPPGVTALSATTLLALATAAAGERRVTLRYGDWRGVATARPFDPYAIVRAANAAWYAVGYCHLREGLRTFRLDRVAAVEPEGTSFSRPPDFDGLAHVQRSLALLPARWAVEVVLDAPSSSAHEWVSPLVATVEEEGGVTVLRCTTTDLDWLARTLAGLPCDFHVRTPPELRGALGRVMARLARAASVDPALA